MVRPFFGIQFGVQNVVPLSDQTRDRVGHSKFTTSYRMSFSGRESPCKVDTE